MFINARILLRAQSNEEKGEESRTRKARKPFFRGKIIESFEGRYIIDFREYLLIAILLYRVAVSGLPEIGRRKGRKRVTVSW